MSGPRSAEFRTRAATVGQTHGMFSGRQVRWWRRRRDQRMGAAGEALTAWESLRSGLFRFLWDDLAQLEPSTGSLRRHRRIREPNLKAEGQPARPPRRTRHPLRLPAIPRLPRRPLSRSWKSLANFAFLKQEFPHAAESASFAERHVFGDPRASCFHARHALEQPAQACLQGREGGLKPPKVTNLDGYISDLAFRELVPEVVLAEGRIHPEPGGQRGGPRQQVAAHH